MTAMLAAGSDVSFTAAPSFIIGMGLLVVAIIAAAVTRSRRPPVRNSPGVKRCAHCREIVPADAVACTRCHRPLTDPT